MNSINNKQLSLFALSALILVTCGIFIGRWFNPDSSNTNAKPVPATSAAHSEKKVLYWYDPMVPNQHFDKPGPSPFMDMALVPKYAEANSNSDSPALHIDPAITQNLGMRLTKVEAIALQQEVNVTGTLGFNERKAAVVQLRAQGFVEKVWPLAVGDIIRQGQPIAEFLIPEWASAQYEYLAVKTTEDKHLLHAARIRMELLGMPQASINVLEKTGEVQEKFTVRAPISGAIQTLMVKNGMTFSSGQTLATINNLDQLWLDAALPEVQAAQFKAGDSAEFFPNTLNNIQNNASASSLTGKIESLLPNLDTSSRTVTARILLDNSEMQLKPGASGRVLLRSQSNPSMQGLALATEAILHSGQTALVLLAEGEGKFRPAKIQIGAELGDKTIVLSGLSEGQEVVASAQFILDSEASMLGIRAAAEPENSAATMNEMNMVNTDETPEEFHQATGTILELADGRARIDHSEFHSLSDNRLTMDAMTMRFRLENPALVEQLKVGDQVTITARINHEGYWILTKIEKIKAEKIKTEKTRPEKALPTSSSQHQEHPHD